MSSSSKQITITPVAKSVPFDNSTNGFISTNAQSAIEEVNTALGISASPGFTWGRNGNVNSNTWLLNDSVPSNNSGRVQFLLNASIVKVFVANENPTAGINIELYSHDGDSVNLTLLGTVTTAATRGNTYAVSYPIALNKQIAIKVANSSATGKNLVVGCLLKGNIS